MYAVIKSGGKQYKVKEGDEILVEKIEVEEGKVVNLDDVLFLNKDGEIITDSQKLRDVKVKGKVIAHLKGDKIIVFKYRPKKRYRKKKGHRQLLTKLLIEKITLGKEEPKKEKGVEKKAEKATKKPREKKGKEEKLIAKKEVAGKKEEKEKVATPKLSKKTTGKTGAKAKRNPKKIS